MDVYVAIVLVLLYEFTNLLIHYSLNVLRGSEAHVSFRWNSSWLLMGSCLTLIALYSLWLPLTLSGRIPRHHFRDRARGEGGGGGGGGDMSRQVEYRSFPTASTELELVSGVRVKATDTYVVEESVSNILHTNVAV